jgi:NADH-quinone oxidoreductase subunit G
VPTLTIDGRAISVPDGTTVIQAAEKLGIFVPRYCYHPGLSIAGNCRICLVDVEKVPKLQIACNTPVIEGMMVQTKSQKAEEGRRAVLEFLLANHPLDCPVCDQSGECDLQNFYLDFGLYDPRFREQKVKKRKAVALGPHVMLDQERCILCSRCVRFTDEITKTGEFGIFNRGDHAEVGICAGHELNNRYSANVEDICRVGALTERDFRFIARVWYLSSAPSVCIGCSQGCNIDLHYVLDRPPLNGGKRVVRVKPRYNPDVNKWWICDEGRYGFEWVDHGRLGTQPDWDGALNAICAALGPHTGVIASTQLTTEELFLVREIFQRSLGAKVTASVPQKPGYSDDFLIKADKNPNTAGAMLLGLAGPDAILAEEIIDDALAGNLDVLWVMGHDLVELLGEEKARRLAAAVRMLVFSGTNDNATVPMAQWVLPTAAYLEKDGSFVNCHGRVQRFARAFPPFQDSREDWRILLDVAARLSLPFPWRSPAEISSAIAEAVAP